MADSTSTHWTHDLDPFLLRFPESWPLDGIRWYGLAYLLGFAVAAWLLHIYYKRGRSPIGPEEQTNLLTALILGTLIGGRLGYMLLYDFGNFAANPLLFFQFQKGGMASHGGMVGIFLAMVWFARRAKMPFLSLADIVVTLGPAGVFFGRIANFINGELWGKTSNVPWAVIFPVRDDAGVLIAYTPPVHPSQIYAALLEGLLVFSYLQIRYWRSSITRTHPGQLGCEFLIAYGLVRIIGEIFRAPDAGLILGLSRGTFYSSIMVIIGLGVLLWRRKVTATTA